LMERYPSMVGHHLGVLHSFLESRELAVVGSDWADLAGVYWSSYRPNVVLAPSSTGEEPIPLLEGRSKPGATLAYVCQNHVCALPTSDPDDLAGQLMPDG
ncbi:MAG: thioredoxin domain-containing protein, partial [Acidimicrobiia bacterium]